MSAIFYILWKRYLIAYNCINYILLLTKINKTCRNKRFLPVLGGNRTPLDQGPSLRRQFLFLKNSWHITDWIFYFTFRTFYRRLKSIQFYPSCLMSNNDVIMFFYDFLCFQCNRIIYYFSSCKRIYVLKVIYPNPKPKPLSVVGFPHMSVTRMLWTLIVEIS